ncbi:geranylgeranyl transferas-like protein type i beta subunit [Amniculicola lignicola CBS 123094]|uniref:Geranylgeranyl transferas-like protein type i beta subunit n=1 Tax=Amniculicola lignicola CBS 123094 TaxID=1392246 RepID=A0A6A5VVJ6_9PLEO|nr:geranylgeranyl transferas-like protein type i beta subunit [Amniculicola lignicola CBS 123094]
MCSAANDESTLNYARHISYWRRNLKTFLPSIYQGNDSNRMTFGFFILTALDVLGDLHSALPPEERQGHIEWVYTCQLPEGCFRASPGTDFGSHRNADNAKWDPGHMPATFFALLLLVLLKDDLGRVKRREILIWLNKMQRPDGSFGEKLFEGSVEGGNDTRFGYMAAGIRWLLRGTVEGPVDGVPDIDVDKFVKCVRISETYDGGISEEPFQEAHAGFACCAISALQLLDRLPLQPTSALAQDDKIRGIPNLPLLLKWLVSRQTLTLEEEDNTDTLGDEIDSSATCHDSHSFIKLGSYPSVGGRQSFDTQPTSHFELSWVGLNGRCNKIADTCYAYWACAPLHILGRLDLVDKKPVRRWLLDKTQHIVGGFGKMPGDPPDVYHSCLGLMVLAIFGETGLKDVDAGLCMSNSAKSHLESLPWRREILGLGPVQSDVAQVFDHLAVSGG